MSIPIISSVTPAAGSFLAGAVAEPPKQELDQADFLKLLTTQMTAQDPLKPMEDTQFVAQMAQFSSLQQANTLTKDFKAFSSAQQISSAQNLLGKTVTLSADGITATGPVTEIQIQNGTAQIIVNGATYDPSSVTNIVNTPNP